jgi:hypothetical protein
MADKIGSRENTSTAKAAQLHHSEAKALKQPQPQKSSGSGDEGKGQKIENRG